MEGEQMAPSASSAHMLPQLWTAFVGRVDETAEIKHLLDDPACRLLTLVGPGGSGKTRLAVQVAAQKQEEFPDSIYFVPLAPISSTVHLIPAITSTLGLQFDAHEAPKQQLLNNLREKRLLLILDNFEHLLDGTELVADILSTAPDVKILVTTRETLNLDGEWIRQVNGFPFPTGDAPAAQVDDFAAIQLFVERAQRVRGNFDPSNELRHIALVCQLVDGLPLGIEMAAVWLKTLTCAQIADEIQRNLDF